MQALAQKIKPYVNRTKELAEVRERLELVRRGGLLFEAVLEWYGVPGIGKTTLGQMIGKLCSEIDVPFARLDFRPEENTRALLYADEPLLILEDLINALGTQEPSEFREKLARYHEADEEYLRQERHKRVIGAFLDDIDRLLAKGPMVLLFDTTDQAAPETTTWLEENVLSPLCLTGKCLIIWTGRFPQRWKRFEVRRRVVSEKLGPLTPEDTEEQVGPEGTRIYALTRGHPLGNEEVAEVVWRYKAEGRAAPDLELINVLVDRVIDRYVMKGIEDDLKAAFRVLVVVRQFDVTILRQLLSNFLKEFKGLREPLFLSILGRLKGTYLVEWDPVRKGYAIDPTIRRILALQLCYNHPKRYLQINDMAADIYAEWIKKVQENRSVYVVERLYHRAVPSIIKKRLLGPMIKELREELKGYLGAYYTDEDRERAQRSTDQLLQELERDEEFREIIGDEGFEVLTKTIECHLRELESNLS